MILGRLLQVIESVRCELATGIMPQSETLATQHAADPQGMSQVILVTLPDGRTLSSGRIDIDRRVLLVEVRYFRDRRLQRQHDSLHEIEASLGEDTFV